MEIHLVYVSPIHSRHGYLTKVHLVIARCFRETRWRAIDRDLDMDIHSVSSVKSLLKFLTSSLRDARINYNRRPHSTNPLCRSYAHFMSFSIFGAAWLGTHPSANRTQSLTYFLFTQPSA